MKKQKNHKGFKQRYTKLKIKKKIKKRTFKEKINENGPKEKKKKL